MIFERSFGRIQRGATRREDDTGQYSRLDATDRKLLLVLLQPVQLQIGEVWQENQGLCASVPCTKKIKIVFAWVWAVILYFYSILSNKA
jgi:hypothetical protein